MKNIKQILKEHNKIIAKNLLNNQDLELLLSHAIKKDKIFLFTYPETKLNILEYIKFKYYIKKRLAGFSVATITGKKSFYGIEFLVNKHVLVPRPETEMMVDEVRTYVRTYKPTNITMIDIGTGTACIPISILKNIDVENTNFYAIDISKKALKIAKQNIKIHGLNNKIELKKSDLLKEIVSPPESERASWKLKIENSDIIITANLPYLTKEQIQGSPSIHKEPKLALDGGKNGMDLYIKLFTQIKHVTQEYQPSSLFLLCEIGALQSKIFKKSLLHILPNAKINIKKDLAGLDRIVTINC
ncbi:hypothetical protein C0583_02195 [Candidatus Parcubacteria bacterium]|nr:MAG: hypothetical protein C0583_02195 [Candidatus Parcubacteria bacterium]